jgi:hypothetical protein
LLLYLAKQCSIFVPCLFNNTCISRFSFSRLLNDIEDGDRCRLQACLIHKTPHITFYRITLLYLVIIQYTLIELSISFAPLFLKAMRSFFTLFYSMRLIFLVFLIINGHLRMIKLAVIEKGYLSTSLSVLVWLYLKAFCYFTMSS